MSTNKNKDTDSKLKIMIINYMKVWNYIENIQIFLLQKW